MAKRKELTTTSLISIDGAPEVPMESLTPEQIEYCQKKFKEKASRVMSLWFSNHMDEYVKLKP